MATVLSGHVPRTRLTSDFSDVPIVDPSACCFFSYGRDQELSMLPATSTLVSKVPSAPPPVPLFFDRASHVETWVRSSSAIGRAGNQALALPDELGTGYALDLGLVVVEGRNVVLPHQAEKRSHGDLRQLGGLTEAEPPRANLLQKPEKAHLLSYLQG
jgi:hypothetical protein